MTTPTPAPAAAPAPANTGIPVISDAVRLVRVLFSPGAVFEELNARPTWWGAWIVIGIATAIINLLNSPFQQKVRDIMVARSGRPVPGGGGGMAAKAIGFVTAPLGVLVFGAILASLLYLLMVAFSAEGTFKKAMVIVFYAW